MKKAIAALYITLIAVLAAATFIEYSQGSDFAQRYIYHSPVFCCLWGMLSLLTIHILYKKRLWHKLPTFMLHLSFIIILTGALMSFLTSKKGYIHLRIGSPETCYVEGESAVSHKMPFTLVLNNFRVKHYPGTDAPVDYVSRITCSSAEGKKVEAVISMNNIFKKQGYRFYQSSYDDDQKGTLLSVNYDPWGTPTTYMGYLLLALSMIAVLLSRKGRFRTLLREVFAKSAKPFLCVLLLCMATDSFALDKMPVISDREADSLSATR